MKYILGVDGGNSKTDYLLCRADGTFVDILRCGTCSHEHGGYDFMEKEMGRQLGVLYAKHGIGVGDVAAAAMGLAGADLPEQIAELNKRVQALGFGRYALANDGILGVKAVAATGVCSINGSGTVVLGIDGTGRALQVGGIGPLSGDNAGGYYIVRRGIMAVYDFYYRVGPSSAIVPALMGLMSISLPEELPTAIARQRFDAESAKGIIQVIDRAALDGDTVARAILDGVGVNCGEGVAGCIANLDFGPGEAINIVKAGSIWQRLAYGGMAQCFVQTIQRTVKNPLNLVLLDAPPALGGLFWAKELLEGHMDETYRTDMTAFLTMEKYDERVTHG